MTYTLRLRRPHAAHGRRGDAGKGAVLTASEARAGDISTRVLLVLIASTTLAVAAGVIVYATYFG